MRRFTRILFSLPHNGGAHSAPARERRGVKGPRERPSRGVGRSPTLVIEVSAAVSLLIVATTLAFGAVYPWGYIPLIAVAAGIGVVGLVRQRGVRPDVHRIAAGLL